MTQESASDLMMSTVLTFWFNCNVTAMRAQSPPPHTHVQTHRLRVG